MRYLLPIASLVALLSGTFVQTDFQALQRKYPGSANFYALVDNWITTAFFVSAVLATGLALLQAFITPHLQKHRTRILQLEERVDLVATNVRVVFDALMLQVTSAFKVQQGDDVRASIYVHDGVDHFLLCGRYSPNPNHRKTGRPSYPDNQGCIAKAWANGWWYEGDLGDTVRKYNKRCKIDYNMPTETLKSISMRSRFLTALRLDDDGHPIAVIVVESLTENKFPARLAQRTLQDVGRTNIPLIRSFRDYIPDPRIAKQKGF